MIAETMSKDTRIEHVAKLLHLSKSQVKEAVDSVPCNYLHDACECSATTQHDAEMLYYRSKKRTKAERIGFLKWLKLCNLPVEAKRAYNLSEQGSELRKMAIFRIYELFLVSPN